MRIAQHAELVLTSAPLKLSPRVISTKSIQMFAPIVVHVQMSALLKLYILHNTAFQKIKTGKPATASLFLFWIIFRCRKNTLEIWICHQLPQIRITVPHHI